MSGMDNILSKMYAKNSDFQEIVDKYIITGGVTSGQVPPLPLRTPRALS